jgi:Adenylate and Guanylate cyclase catalytic domain/AAA ATPase domain
VLAYFGYPQAHEDDAERAAHAGLGLVESVSQLDDSTGTPLRVRIGIATGLVVVGDLLGEGTGGEHAVVGETPNLATRLQALAEPDSVLIDADTRRLLGGLFEYRDMGMVSVKGFGDPVPVWHVISASAVESRFEALRASPSLLVGRGEEIELLLRRWQEAKSGKGRAIVIVGEPGIGKSRIVAALQGNLQGVMRTRYCAISARRITRTSRCTR